LKKDMTWERLIIPHFRIECQQSGSHKNAIRGKIEDQVFTIKFLVSPRNSVVRVIFKNFESTRQETTYWGKLRKVT